MCVGETATLSISGQNLTQVSWSSNNITINSADAVIAPMQTTTYSVMVTNTQGCSSATLLTQVVSACTGLSEQSALDAVAFYPNPTSGKIIGTNLQAGTLVQMSDISGRILSSQTIQTAEYELDLTEFNSGIYFITLKSEKDLKTIKVIRD